MGLSLGTSRDCGRSEYTALSSSFNEQVMSKQPTTAPGRYSKNGYPVLRVCVCSLPTALSLHLDWWNAEHKLPYFATSRHALPFLFLYKTLIDGLESCGLCFNQLFGLSFWRHPFNAEDPLVNILNIKFSKSVLMKKQTHLQLGWPEGEYLFSKLIFLGELFL